ncbi:hypothetical protein LCGC14_0598390, partial [marine sediment metagenome]
MKFKLLLFLILLSNFAYAATTLDDITFCTNDNIITSTDEDDYLYLNTEGNDSDFTVGNANIRHNSSTATGDGNYLTVWDADANQYIGNNTLHQVNTGVTSFFFSQQPTTTSNSVGIFMGSTSGITNGFENAWFFYANSIEFASHDGSTGTACSPRVFIVPYDWYNFTVVYNHTLGTMDVYYYNGTGWASCQAGATDRGTADPTQQVRFFMSSVTTHVDNIMWYNGTDCPVMADLFPPTLSNAVCTSCDSGTNDTIDSTPTINVTCVDDVACQMVRISNDSTLTFGSATVSRNCTQGTGNNWICTLISADKLTDKNTETTLYFLANDTNGNNHSVSNLTISITLQDPYLKLNELNKSRYYEFETTVNITTNYPFLDVLDNTSRYINILTSPFNFLIDILRINKFNSSNRLENITSGLDNYSVAIDNRTDLYNASVNLTGYDNPIDITINYTNYLFFPGKLIEGNLFQHSFIYEGTKTNKTNITFTTAGSKTIFINFSNQGNLNRTGKFNWTITAFNIDIENELEYINDFGNESVKTGMKYNGTSFSGIWENFVDNSTVGNWQGSPTYRNSDDAYFVDYDYYLYRTTDSATQNIYSSVIDLGKLSMIDFKAKIDRGITYIPDRWYFGAYSISFYDGINEVEIVSEGLGQSGTPVGTTDYFNFTMYKLSSTTWGVYDSKEYSTVSVASYYLKFKIVNNGLAQTTLRLYYLNYSGIWINRTNTTFSGKEGINSQVHTGNYTTHMINETTDDIVAATLNAIILEPTDTNIQFLLSNNNGSTWESVTNGVKHTFSSAGNRLKAKFRLNMSNGNNLSSPLVYSFNAKVVSSPLSSLTIDIGTNNVVSFYYELNASTTPIYNTGTDWTINDYINDSCPGNYCLIPLTFATGSGGIVEFSLLNLTENINPIRFNVTPIQSLQFIPIKPTYTGGTLKIDDIQFDYRGSKNITINAHNSDYSDSINFTVFVKYSPFNLTFPSGVDFFEVFFTSRNQSDVE